MRKADRPSDFAQDVMDAVIFNNYTLEPHNILWIYSGRLFFASYV